MMETLETKATAPETIHLHVVPPRTLTSIEELAIFRAALTRAPHSTELRERLAAMLQQADYFDEAIEVIEAASTQTLSLLLLEAEARLSRETVEDNLAVRMLGLRASELAVSAEDHAEVQALLAKAYVRLGETAEALRCAEKALTFDIGQKNAWKRAVALLLKHDSPAKVLQLSDKLMQQGVNHSRLISSRALAFACLGEPEQARATQGTEEFLKSFYPAPPQGWETLDAFTRDLSEELTNHPDVRFNRYGTASAHTWRIDEPSLQRTPVFPALQRMITREVERYVAELPEGTHPFLAGRPRFAELRNWCVITEGDGHETWHVHQNGWLSGVFYAYVQDHIAFGTNRDGCIAFGLPEDVVGEDHAAAFGETLCRPQTGLMMLFPSHLFHRTYPHHGTGRRICCAFDIIPAHVGGA